MPVPFPKFDPGAWKPSRKALFAAAAAFAAGLLLFLSFWLQQRGHNAVTSTDAAPRSVEGQQFEPLPTPLPADRGDGNASGMDGDVPPGPEPAQIQQIVESPPPAPPPAGTGTAPLPAPAPGVDAAVDSVPQAIRAPAPRYPRAAQRRGESGTVLLRVRVAADGGVDGIDVVQGSGSRDLDRAAGDAVRRWRFRPAMRDGRPVAATVQVPISFDPGR